ncbi:MAG: phage tail tip lysozyme [Streptosporangiaceae bacterium]
MTAAHKCSRKIRKTGRHAAPTQFQQVAQRAGQAAPAVAVAGALAAGASAVAAVGPAAAATQASVSTQAPGSAQAPATTHAPASPQARASDGRSYTVRTGDTLSGIAQRFYGHAGDWPYLYRINRGTVSDPNLIYTGEVLRVPTDPPASVLTGSYRPRHARTGSPATTASSPASFSATASPAAPASSGSSSPAGQQAVVTASGGRGVACTGSGGALKPLNYGAIVTFLTAHGYSANAAAGIAGNIYQESGGNPESVGDGGGGLIGWTPLPGGYVTGNPAADLQTQLSAILTFNQIWAQYIPALNAAGSPAEAANIYVTDFERAGIPAYGTREAAAEAVAAACGL